MRPRRSALPAVLLLLFAALPCSGAPPRPSRESWPVFRGDAGLSGVSPMALPSRLALRWTFKTGGEVKSSPVIGGGRVFVGSADGAVYCLDLATGRKVWEYAKWRAGWTHRPPR